MAKFIPTGPVRIIHSLWESGLVPHTAMLLADDVLRNPNRVQDFNKAFPLNRFIMLDNSAAELEEALPIESLAEAIMQVRPDVFVLPDVLLNREETLERSTEMYEQFAKNDSRTRSRMLFLPQGNTFLDWVRCLEQAKERMPNLEWIGIPRNIVNQLHELRITPIKLVRAIFPRARIHLFGMSNDMIDDVICANMPEVYSIDSTYPLQTENFTLTEVAPRDPNWLNIAEYQEYMAENVRFVYSIMART